jgi:pimeloyl-ACP methyl ester carboxylesterase
METVVVVHGLWMHGVIMWCLARRITRCGFDVKVYSYPSMRLSLSENAARLAAYCASLGVARVHFVAHSLGGLVALKMLASGHEVHCGRMVLLGTPSGGSFAARRLHALPGGGALLGRSIGEWLRQTPATPASVPLIGVVAGTRSVGLGQLVAPDLPKPNDGVVAVEETTLAGMTSRVTLKVAHSGMLVSRVVARQCCAFLRHGSFEDAAA